MLLALILNFAFHNIQFAMIFGFTPARALVSRDVLPLSLLR